MIRAVTFDFWDTLVHAPSAATSRQARLRRLNSILEQAGATLSAEKIELVLAQIRREFDDHWAANTQYTGYDATDRLIERIGIDVDDATREAMAHKFMGIDDPWTPDLTPNIASTLRALKERDVQLGIICDVGLSPSVVLRSYLDRHGVLDLFDHWSFSDDVGVYKPDRAIFEHASKGLGDPDPSELAHVGDLRRTDVAGALAVGWTAVRYSGSNDDVDRPGEGDRSMAVSDVHAPEAPIVLNDHADLPSALGLD